MPDGKTHSRGLMLIAAFKLLKGLALLAVGIGALRLLRRGGLGGPQRVSRGSTQSLPPLVACEIAHG
jgi:hypothetical protein